LTEHPRHRWSEIGSLKAEGSVIRIALLADTHGSLDPRIEELVTQCDIALHGGDIGGADILARLAPRSGRVHAVVGNNDTPSKWPEHQRGLLEGLPQVARLALPGGELVVVHGHRLAAKGRHERLRRQHPGARAIMYGHSHRLLVDRDIEPWVLNPGAAGRKRTHGGPSCMVLIVAEHRWSLAIHRFEPVRTVIKRRPRGNNRGLTTNQDAIEHG
jgi:hypothetical protein